MNLSSIVTFFKPYKTVGTF